MRTAAFGFSAFLIGTSIAAAAASVCPHDETVKIDSIGGTELLASGEFTYESRAEHTSVGSKNYIWCITNNSTDDIITVHWGSEADEEEYFSGTVVPAAARPRVFPSALDVLRGPKTLRYRTGFTSWHDIKPETIHYHSFLSGTARHPSIHQVQVEGVPDDQRLVSYAIFDVPTSNAVVEQLENGTYEKYDRADFFAVIVSFSSSLIEKGGGEHYVSNAISVEPVDETDAKLFGNVQIDELGSLLVKDDRHKKIADVSLSKLAFNEAFGVGFSDVFNGTPSQKTGKLEILLAGVVTGSMPVTFFKP